MPRPLSRRCRVGSYYPVMPLSNGETLTGDKIVRLLGSGA